MVLSVESVKLCLEVKKEDLFWPWWTAWTFNLKIVWLLPPQYISNRCIWCVCVVFIVFTGRFSGSSRGSPARTLDQGQGRLQHQAGGNYYSNVIQTWPCLWGYTYRGTRSTPSTHYLADWHKVRFSASPLKVQFIIFRSFPNLRIKNTGTYSVFFFVNI